MKKTIECTNWKDYDGLNGAVMFCSAGAYGKKLTEAEARACGCTMANREKCMNAMVNSMGYGLVPEIEKETATKEIALVYAPLAHAV